MKRFAWLLGAGAACGAVVFAVACLLARPGGLRVGEGPVPTPSTTLDRAEFWTAVRDFDLASAFRADRPPDRRRFALALRMVAEGRRTEAVGEFSALSDNANETRIREESKEALKRLLRATARWDEPAGLDPDGLEGEAYRGALPQRIRFPDEPVQLATEIGWLRIPRVHVELNGRGYTFAVDSGADPTVITDEVAAKCGIEVGAQAALTETSTRRRVEWRAAVARELRLGGIVLSNHPIAVVSKEDLDLGLIQLDGILGWPVFEHMRVEIDYGNGVTTLSEPDARSVGRPRNLFWLGYPMVELRGPNGVPLFFGLDTGARDTSLNKNILNKLDLEFAEPRRRLSIGAGGAETVSTRRVSGFRMLLGGRVFSFDKISIKGGVKDLAVFEPDGRLGGDVAYGGKMIVDFPNGRFDLEALIRD